MEKGKIEFEDPDFRPNKRQKLTGPEILGKKQGPGPTGRFTHGKIRSDDRGELAIAISIENGQIMMRFGTLIEWMALPPAEARRFAALILARADDAERMNIG